MTSDDLDRSYLKRTHKIAEERAMPEVFQALFSGGMYVLDGSFDVSLIEQQTKMLRERLSTEPWVENGTMNFDLNSKFSGSRGTLTVEYDSESAENLVRCVRQNAHPDADDATLLPMVRKELKDYRRVKSFILKNERRVFDSREHLPGDWSVHAYVLENARLIDTAYANTEFHFIMSPQPVDSRFGIHGLLHEIGHVVEDHGLSPKDLARRAEVRGKKSMSTPEKKELILSERNANAFALANLRYFFGPENMDVFRQLAYTAQRGYHRKIAEQ